MRGPGFSVTITGMKQIDRRGEVSLTLVFMIVFIVLFLGAAGFGVWSFMSRQDYKNNTDQKVSAAVEEATETTKKEKDKEWEEKEKQPYRDYISPAPFGTVNIKYPKTWSGYVSENPNTANPVDGYFHPNYVPGVTSGTNFAIRVQVSEKTYDQEVKLYATLVKTGKVTSTPYKAPKVPGVTGTRLEKEIFPKKQGTMILLPSRDKTLKIWTESTQFTPDLDNIVLANLTFVP